MNDDNQNLNDDQLIDLVTDQILERIILKVGRNLSDEDLDVLNKLTESDKDGRKIKRYLLEKVPNLETIIFEELQAVRKQAS